LKKGNLNSIPNGKNSVVEIREAKLPDDIDFVRQMEAAHSLYRSFGFQDISAYPEVEIPKEFRQYLLFMELDLY
jgi:hypothetical protein